MFIHFQCHVTFPKHVLSKIISLIIIIIIIIIIVIIVIIKLNHHCPILSSGGVC
jgi:hypothetical protein